MSSKLLVGAGEKGAKSGFIDLYERTYPILLKYTNLNRVSFISNKEILISNNSSGGIKDEE